MVPSFLQPHFELWAPKLARRVTLFDPLHVRLCTLLESNPRVSVYCERPAYWDRSEGKQLIDFWVKAGRREMCWVVTSESRPRRAGTLSPGENIDVRYIHNKHLVSHAVWIENWMRILPYLKTRYGSRLRCYQKICTSYCERVCGPPTSRC